MRRALESLALGGTQAVIWWLVTRNVFVTTVAFAGGVATMADRGRSLRDRALEAAVVGVTGAVIAIYLKL